MDQWLVRTVKNVIAGPFSREQVRQMIIEGKLGTHDEVCAANQYWVMLHEREEVVRQLGEDIPAHLSEARDEEATQTQTDTTHLEVTDPEFQPAGAFGGDEQQTAMLSRSSSLPLQPMSNLTHAELMTAGLQPPPVLGTLERPSIWRGFALLMVALAVFLIFTVLNLLSTR